MSAGVVTTPFGRKGVALLGRKNLVLIANCAVWACCLAADARSQCSSALDRRAHHRRRVRLQPRPSLARPVYVALDGEPGALVGGRPLLHLYYFGGAVGGVVAGFAWVIRGLARFALPRR